MRIFKHLTMTDRLKIEQALKLKKSKKEIAEIIHVHISTIYRELKRGEYEHKNTDWTTEMRYSPDIANKRYRENLAAKGAMLKIGSDRKLAEHIEHKICDEKYSPAAVLGEIKHQQMEFSVTISVPTLYSYITKGIFLRLTNKDLPDKSKRKRDYNTVRAARPPRGTSIEKRPPEVDTRETFGHWEMDTVKGARGTSKKSLLVLTERKTRQELQFLLPDGTAESVVRVLDRLERKYGVMFPVVFKSITIDNGPEFSDCAGMERSCIHEGKRTDFYYCHPYSSYERGSNEKQNRMIRRHVPKGENFDDMPESEIERITVWLNNYPRGIFDYGTSQEAFDIEMDAILSKS